MDKEITVSVMQKEQIDPDSIAVTLDFDGITNVPEIMKLLDARLQAGTQVKWTDVVVILWAIYSENKKRRANK